MISKKHTRDYEVSIWTLQDSFITVLKHPDIENNGQIQDAKMTLKDDGENSLSFKLPMYILDKNGEFIENPIWYNIINGNIIAGMRKIKVIFNRDKNAIFEFIISKVNELHEGRQKYCEVTCSGLAFHELGHQGYNIILSGNDFNQEDWNALTEGTSRPVSNINYWIEKVLINTNWSYEIQMDWPGHADWATNKIYNNAYVSSWNVDNNYNLSAAAVVNNAQELERFALVEASKSNRYNLLQKIAEAFQVFCKFEYQHDDTYHIIGRKVIFYNNFLNEKDVIDFNYGYNAKKITREMDSSDIISKMIVSPLSDSGTYYGEINLSDSLANIPLENFLLNFDYLYSIGTITKEQYEYVSTFQAQLRSTNSQLNEYQESYKVNSSKKVELESSLAYWESLSNEAGERASEAISALSDYNEICERNLNNPMVLQILGKDNPEQNSPYALFGIQGRIREKTLTFYKEKPYTDDSTTYVEGSNEQTVLDNKKISKKKIKYTLETNSSGNTSKIIFTTIPTSLTKVYVTFKYDPNIGQQEIARSYEAKQMQANQKISEIKNNLAIVNTAIENADTAITSLTDEKEDLIAKFERLMGPALREGTWQPDDEYAKYQTINTCSIDIQEEDVGFFWDKEIFDEEQKLTYYSGTALETIAYYPCLKLTDTVIEAIVTGTNLNFVHRNKFFGFEAIDFQNEEYEGETDPRLCEYLQINDSDVCKIVFLQNRVNNEIYPALLFIIAEKMIDYTDDSNRTKTILEQLQNHARISDIIFKTPNDNNDATVDVYSSIEENELVHPEDLVWINTENYDIVYPRFYIKDDRFISNTDKNLITLNNTKLTEYEDYYEKHRENYYYFTLKPNKIMADVNENSNASLTFSYTQTTAVDAMYLDAVKIMKENSTPKVSYTIDPHFVNEDFLKYAYNKIGQIAHINDYELKFENVQGYISEVSLNLGKPWEDSYSIKNYKTKFEDLFSSIVASTESMKSNSQTFGMLSNLITSNGTFNTNLLQQALSEIDLSSILAKYYSSFRQNSGIVNIARNNANIILAKGLESIGFDDGETVQEKITNSLESLSEEYDSKLEELEDTMNETISATEDSCIPTITRGTTEPNEPKKGDIFYNTNNNIQYIYNDSAWVAVAYSPKNYNIVITLPGLNDSKIGDTCIYQNQNYIYTASGWKNLDILHGAKINIDPDAGTIDLLAENSISLQGRTVSITAGSYTSNNGTIHNGAISFITTKEENNQTVSNNVFTMSEAGIMMYTDSLFSAVGSQVYIGTTGAINSHNGASYLLLNNNRLDFVTNGELNITGGTVNIQASNNSSTDYLRMSEDQQGNRQILMATSGNMKIGAGGSLTIGAGSSLTIGTDVGNNAAILSLLTTGKLQAFGSTIVIASAEKINNNQPTGEPSTAGSYIWMHDVQENNSTVKKLDIGTSGDLQILSNGKFSAVAADEVFIATTEKDNNGNPQGSYIWMHEDSGTKKLDIGTTGKITFDNNNFVLHTNDNSTEFRIGSAGNPAIQYRNGSLTVSGTIEASAGSHIGGWYIGSNYIGSANTRGGSQVGLSWVPGTNGGQVEYPSGSGTYVYPLAFWAGGVGSGNNINQANFFVRTDGELYSCKGKIGGWTLGSDYIGDANYRGTSNVGMSAPGANAEDGFIVFWAGGQVYEGNNNVLNANTTSFYVTKNGTIKATKGKIAGWHIGDDYMGSASTRVTSKVGISSASSNSTTNGPVAFWAGGSGNPAVDGSLDTSNLKFYVRSTGELYATQASIQGEIKGDTGYIGGWNIEGTTLSATNVNSSIKLATDSDTWAGEFSGKYLYLNKNSGNETKIVRFLINSSKNSGVLDRDGNTFDQGIDIQNLPISYYALNDHNNYRMYTTFDLYNYYQNTIIRPSITICQHISKKTDNGNYSYDYENNFYMDEDGFTFETDKTIKLDGQIQIKVNNSLRTVIVDSNGFLKIST